jgi:hypothetical protein
LTARTASSRQKAAARRLLLFAFCRGKHASDDFRPVPGHGGLLDRFDSLVMVPLAVFHYLSLYNGPLGGGEVQRIFTGP